MIICLVAHRALRSRQEAGEPLKLPFVKHHYGPYSDTLRHALNTMEGHFIRGLGDGVVEAEIEPTEDALAEAEAFIAEQEHAELAGHVERVGRLIEGYQSTYGMELLASVHWVATHEPGVRTLDEAIAAVHRWNDRKKMLMKPEHIASAWHRLEDEGWLAEGGGSQAVVAASTRSPEWSGLSRG